MINLTNETGFCTKTHYFNVSESGEGGSTGGGSGSSGPSAKLETGQYDQKLQKKQIDIQQYTASAKDYFMQLISKERIDGNGVCDPNEIPIIDEECNLTLDNIKSLDFLKYIWVMRLYLLSCLVFYLVDENKFKSSLPFLLIILALIVGINMVP
jgi:hypothetical protein